jgi:type I restriction enzyme, S subunit
MAQTQHPRRNRRAAATAHPQRTPRPLGSELAKFAEQGKAPPKDWQKKYPEPVQPDTRDLPELPEGWVWASVEQIASDERYSLSIGPFGSNLKVSDYRDTGVPLVFVRNIRSGNYGGAHTKYVTPEKAIELVAHSASACDVLITKMGEPPGDADIYPDNQPLAIITADCIKVRCWDGLIRPDFLKSVINSHIGQQQIEPMTQGVAQKKVSLGRFTSLAVPIPSMKEQQQIMAMASEANAESAAQETATALSIKQSTAQRKNILRAAFSGQLVPQDPNDEPASALLARILKERAKNASTTLRRGKRADAGE